MRNRANIFDLYRQVKLKESEILERTLTDAEKEKLKKLEKEVPMKDFKDRYGKEGESVYYATLTKMAKDEGFASDAQRRAAFAQGYKAKGKKGKKEETELDEKFTKKDFDKNEDENRHTENAIELVKMFGTSAEDIKVNAIAARHNMKGSIDRKDQQERDALVKKYYPKLKEEVEINEDGHQDVASAIRQCKTITEDAMQIMSKLQSMSPEDSLPTWWTNKLAVASNSMNKMRDYLLVPSVSESVELDEKAGDTNDMKKLVGELQNASKMHLAQSKRVRAHLNMMKAGNLRGTVEIAPIINELEKASEAHKRQSKIIAKHMEVMGEETLNEQPEHEITVGNYTTKHFYMCGSAQTVMKKHADKDGAEELTRMQDVFYKMEKDAMDAGSANDEQKKKSQILYDKIMAKAKEVGIADEVGKYMKMHLDSMLKGNPKLGFGRTDMKESYQDMIARIMSQRSMR